MRPYHCEAGAEGIDQIAASADGRVTDSRRELATRIAHQPHRLRRAGCKASHPPPHRLCRRPTSRSWWRRALALPLHPRPVEVQMPRDEAWQGLPPRLAVWIRAAMPHDPDHRLVAELALPRPVVVHVHHRMPAGGAARRPVPIRRTQQGSVRRQVHDMRRHERASLLTGRVRPKETRWRWRRRGVGLVFHTPCSPSASVLDQFAAPAGGVSSRRRHGDPARRSRQTPAYITGRPTPSTRADLEPLHLAAHRAGQLAAQPVPAVPHDARRKAA